MRYLLFFFAAAALAEPGEDCRIHKLYGRNAEARQCFQKLASSSNSYLRAEGQWGLENFQAANNEFRAAVKANPAAADYRARWGRLFLERFNRAEAEQLFKEALELKPNHAGAMLGMALVASDGFEAKAVEFAQKALESDPKLLEAQELIAKLALEDNNPEKATAEAKKALEMSGAALEAMAILGTIDLLNGKKPSAWFDKIFKVNPAYGEAWAVAGHFFVLNRRYEEGIDAYKQALAISPDLQEARAQLGVNLMRLGEEKAAREALETAWNAGYKNALTTNTLTLMDSYKNFITYKTPLTIVRLHKKEAELLKPYVEGELIRAIEIYEKKYKLKLTSPVQVEVYPDHEDFAVRTLGMPGLGALGVTFGHVVAMDSPSGRPPGRFHWASTLWHELSHVYVLTATNHRVPRWFTEGMAVHEETAISPDWGDRLDGEAIRAIKGKKLLPIAQLDRGFIRPSYPSQVVVSYFEAGRICDYIDKTWGYQKLLDMMHSFGESKSTPEVVEMHLGMKPEEFDTKFLAWLEAQTKKTVEGYDEWRKKMKVLLEAARAGKHEEVIKEAPGLIAVYPDYVEAESAYELLANAWFAKNDKTAGLRELERYSAAGGRSPELLKKLATLQIEAGKKKEAAHTLQRLIYVYPMEEELHRKLGDLYMEMDNMPGAIVEYTALVASRPADVAGSRYNLARALYTAKRTEAAKEQLLLSLEAAPGFKPAQKLLLELSR
jgi:tetratricopeptide (TPR) repeat protein